MELGGDGLRDQFWLASLLTEGRERTAEHAEAVLGRAREVAGKKPSRLTTDELPAYGAGGRWVFGWRYCEHWAVDWRRGRGPRNLMERKIQTTRTRLKAIRCFKNLGAGQGWLDGAMAHYNFVRRHMALGRTPAEAAGIRLKLGRNSWLGLIAMSAKIFILVYLPKMKQNLDVFSL